MERVPSRLLLDGQQRILEMLSLGDTLTSILDAVADLGVSLFSGLAATVVTSEGGGVPYATGAAGLPAALRARVKELLPSLPASARAEAIGGIPGISIRTDAIAASPLWTSGQPLCEQLGFEAAWLEPVRRRGKPELLGLVVIYLPARSFPTAEQVDLLTLLSRLAGLAIEQRTVRGRMAVESPEDPLTGLASRQELEDRGADIFCRAHADATPLSLAVIGVDDLEPLRKKVGPAACRALLRDIGSLLMAELGHASLLARIAEDSFVALLPESMWSARDRIDALRGRVAERAAELAVGRRVTLSCGLVQQQHQPTDDLASCLSQAEATAAQARRLGGDRCIVVDATQSGMWLRRRLIGHMMADAIGQSDSCIDYRLQPIVRLPDGVPDGFELLLRLAEPQLAEMPVQECIAVAEENGLIHRIGLTMFRHACELTRVRDLRMGRLNFNVNVSVQQLMRREFCDEVGQLLAEHKVSPRRFCLEITESHWLDADSCARATLGDLKSMGFGLALDDFGTGYASVAALQSLPFDTMKVDRRFVARVGTDDKADALCSALLAMGNAVGGKVIAEGVETSEQAARLHRLGYQFAQGFRWARPMKLAEAVQWLERQREAAEEDADTQLEWPRAG